MSDKGVRRRLLTRRVFEKDRVRGAAASCRDVVGRLLDMAAFEREPWRRAQVQQWGGSGDDDVMVKGGGGSRRRRKNHRDKISIVTQDCNLSSKTSLTKCSPRQITRPSPCASSTALDTGKVTNSGPTEGKNNRHRKSTKTRTENINRHIF